jgi:hypothetical protein
MIDAVVGRDRREQSDEQLLAFLLHFVALGERGELTWIQLPKPLFGDVEVIQSM